MYCQKQCTIARLAPNPITRALVNDGGTISHDDSSYAGTGGRDRVMNASMCRTTRATESDDALPCEPLRLRPPARERPVDLQDSSLNDDLTLPVANRSLESEIHRGHRRGGSLDEFRGIAWSRLLLEAVGAG